MDLILISCLSVLYWFAAINLAYVSGKDIHKDNKTFNISFTLMVILLKYVPTVLLQLAYLLIYFQMENLFIMSRM